MSGNSWTCPFCQTAQLTSDKNEFFRLMHLEVGQTADGRMGLAVEARRCVDKDCLQLTLATALWKITYHAQHGYIREGDTTLDYWQMRPMSNAKVFPDYIPAQLLNDYHEACLIRDLSPKASATLSRRCLQGMIRDFTGIAKGRLIDEIRELNERLEQGIAPQGVQIETVTAIDAVRDIGNIGAHMEKDINVIIEVDANEAQALIELIELLFEEWYVARHQRQQKLAKVQAIAADKKAIKAGSEMTALPRPATP